MKKYKLKIYKLKKDNLKKYNLEKYKLKKYRNTADKYRKLSPDAVIVEVVEDGQAVLVTLPVVRLGSSSTEKTKLK